MSEVYTLTPQPSVYDRAAAASIIQEAAENADAMLESARQEALAIIDAAQQQSDEFVAAIRARLRGDVEREVRAQIANEMDATFARFQEVIAGAQFAEDGLRNAAYADSLALSLGIAEHIIGRELSVDPALVKDILTRALEQVAIERVTRIIVHPNDFIAVDQWVSTALASHRAEIEIATDLTIEPGGCIVGTKTGFIDARIQTQLAEVRRALAEVVEHA